AADSGVTKDLPNFHRVNENLYRGGQPKDEGFAELKKIGIATVIDLRGTDDNSSREKSLAEAAGLRFINIPLDNWGRPANNDIESIIAQINDPKNQPVFVHCNRGSDRTGTVIAVYRITHDGWSGKQASDEANEFGLGWWQVWMKGYIADYSRDRGQNK
ncbi:MAG: tyrosine-protein phosphatase, partial [Acidobacteriota bacterium]